MDEVAAGRSIASALPVDIQLKAIVGAHQNDKVIRLDVQTKDLSKMKHPRLAERSCRMRNPTGMPFLAFVGHNLRY